MCNAVVFRILDASLNRAAEGLRVIEDYVRFGLDDPLLTQLAKSLRHDLAEAVRPLDSSQRLVMRDTLGDVGTVATTPAERARADAWDVCAASFKRLEQSLRSLEEYGKLVDADVACRVEAIRYRVYTLEKAVGLATDVCRALADTRLMVLVDGCASIADFERLVAELVAAGVGAIQLRDKQLADRDLLARAHRLRELTRNTTTLAIVNDRADIAALAAADGVHLGQDDLSVNDARAIIGPRMLIGVSTHHMDQARQAVLEGANYLGAGPTFRSSTKAFANFSGLDYLRALAAETSLPTFAIGGITADNLPDVLSTGVSRVAVGAAIAKSDNPRVAARGLLSILKSQVAETNCSPSTLIPES